jgi:hypothetical protein
VAVIARLNPTVSDIESTLRAEGIAPIEAWYFQQLAESRLRALKRSAEKLERELVHEGQLRAAEERLRMQAALDHSDLPETHVLRNPVLAVSALAAEEHGSEPPCASSRGCNRSTSSTPG